MAGAIVHTLHPGDLAFATRGERLDTLLGSCVAIVLTDPRRTVGVMCHIVHARPAQRAVGGSAAYDFLGDRGFTNLAIYDGQIEPYQDLEFGRIDAVNLIRAHALVESGKAIGKVVLEGF